MKIIDQYVYDGELILYVKIGTHTLAATVDKWAELARCILETVERENSEDPDRVIKYIQNNWPTERLNEYSYNSGEHDTILDIIAEVWHDAKRNVSK